MQADLVDSRDIRWEVDLAVFRVRLWRSVANDAGSMSESADYRMKGATQTDVQDWTRDQLSISSFTTAALDLEISSSDGGTSPLAPG